MLLSELEKKIIKTLREDSRISIRELARKLNAPHSTVYEKLRRLEREGIIRSYTIIVDYKKLGYTVTALILVNVEGSMIVDVENWLAKEPNVLAVYDITGEYDIAIIASFKSIDELDAFIKKILKNPYIKQTRTSIVFRKVKEEIHLPL